MILEYQGFPPVLAESAFIAPSAVIVGRVTVGDRSSIWFNCVVRGDINEITIGSDCNIQDGSLIHVTGRQAVKIGDRVTVGHGAIIHGCQVNSDCLIAMGAIVLDEAIVGTGSIVAAGAVVSPGTVIPEMSLVRGVPGKVVRELTAEDRRRIERGWSNYVRYAEIYRQMKLDGQG